VVLLPKITCSLQVTFQDETSGLASNVSELRAAVDVLANAPSSPAPLKVEVESAGQCVGSFAHVWINGEEAGHLEDTAVDHPGWVRGINAFTIDLVSGKVTARSNFDTCCPSAGKTTAGENQRLRDFIDGLADGTVVAFAIIDEGTVHALVTLLTAHNSLFCVIPERFWPLANPVSGCFPRYLFNVVKHRFRVTR
jgi:hypothetical protein